ncbi:hypothetical protein [Bovifimicola ammoniilytica]|jgi:DNA-directed RNA polymerase specialized sigma subunit|uniref:hypothetical protein n=1 Tax=Bovifimicola ammoniilytica TaxID=2981720 RepID=UPI0008206A1C|nr:hypothetical protein [Bovifimicola ammoniilytica]MCU6752369.1 hypothetical protein [Bovifimicola ammoniilytica]SCJ22511.1 Uncharacterised protein [uncultured Eubacterium sp.]
MKSKYLDKPFDNFEQDFADKNYYLMDKYLNSRKLKDKDEMRSALGEYYMLAVRKYLKNEKLRKKYNFEAICIMTLKMGESNYWRALNRKKRCPIGGIISYDDFRTSYTEDNNCNIVLECNIYIEFVDNYAINMAMAEAIYNELSTVEQKIFLYRFNRWSDSEIRKELNISEYRYDKYLKEIKKKVKRIIKE